MQNSDFRTRITSLHWSQTRSVFLCMYNSVISTRITRFYGSLTSPVVLCMKNSMICNRMTGLNGFQPSSVVLCMQNSDFWSRITSLYGSQTSPVVLCLQKLASELLISMGPYPNLWFLAAKLRLFDQNNKCLWVPDITYNFLHAKHRDKHQNCLSLWVPALICGFWMQNSAFWTRITSLYGSQTSLFVLCVQNSVVSIRITSL